MKTAVIETGGKQYMVEAGNIITIEKLSGEHKKGDKIAFDKVLLIDDGKETKLGAPYIKGASVGALFESEGKGKKINIVKFKSKSRYTRRQGHRQPFMKVKIENIG
ncbi:50S ribosomal protein L21 [bacterium]|nr:50S ribosomal protein L21 [bacterium]